MTAEESGERSQRTVAELLAQYGEGGSATGRRRSRRRPEDTGAQPVAEPSTSPPPEQGTNGEQVAGAPTDLFEAGVPGEAAGAALHPSGAGAQPPPGAVPRQPAMPQPPPQAPPPQLPPHAPPPPQAQPPHAGFPEQSWALGEPPPAYPHGQGIAEPMDQAVESAETARWYRHANGAPGWQQPDGYQNGPVVEPPTDELPRYGPLHTNGRAGPPVDERGDPTVAGVALDDLDPRDAEAFGPADDLDGEAAAAVLAERRRVDRTDSAEGSPTTAWLAMVAQWIGGAIGGAALWVAFRYLWTAMPVVALVAAVLVTGGLVLLVRAIRRSDDLKTTVFAVLVGLVVTVSPAVLVLVTR